MVKPSKRLLAYALMCIVLLSSGYVVGVLSQGSYPTWDELLGIYNVPWFNASTGVNAPDYFRNDMNYSAWIESISGGVTDHGALTGLDDDDHSQYLLQDGSEELTGDWDVGNYDLTTDGLSSPWIELNGNNRTSWPSGGGVANIQKSVYDYLVYKNVTSTYMVDGTTWAILDSDNDDSTVINWALGNCSGSGPRKEVVVFIGNFDIDTVCYVDDHTYLDMTAATFELTSNAVAIFRNENVGSSQDNSDIVFYGGILDGNRQSRTQGSGIDGCFLDTEIIGVEARQFYEYGMRFRSFPSNEKTKRLTMDRCMISGNAEDEENRLGGLYFSNDGSGSNDNFLSNLLMINNGGFAIKIENAGTDFRIRQFHIVGHPGEAGWPGAKGIWIEGDCDRIQITDGHFENVDNETIHIQPTDSGDFSDNHIVAHNTYKSCSAKELDDTFAIIYLDGRLGSVRYCQVNDNSMMKYAPDTSNEAKYAIWLDHATNCVNNIVDGNVIASNCWTDAWLENDAGVANTIGDNEA